MSRKPITLDLLREALSYLPNTTAGCRDTFVLLLGYGAALTPGELRALRIEDVEVETDRLVLRVDGQDEPIVVPAGAGRLTCPVEAVKSWIQVLQGAGVKNGALLRKVNRHGHIGAREISDKGLSMTIQRAIEATGTDPTGYSGASLRTGALAAIQELLNRPAGHLGL